MCESDAYLKVADKEEKVLTSVNIIEPQGENVWHLVNIFGEQKTIRGRIRSMHLVDHKIIFEAIPEV